VRNSNHSYRVKAMKGLLAYMALTGLSCADALTTTRQNIGLARMLLFFGSMLLAQLIGIWLLNLVRSTE
jgi:hypothetical protein